MSPMLRLSVRDILTTFVAGAASAMGTLLLIASVVLATVNIYYRPTIESPGGVPPWLTANVITGTLTTLLASAGLTFVWLGRRCRRR